MPHLSLERRPMHSRAVNPTSQAQLMNIKEVWCYKPPEGSSSHLFNINAFAQGWVLALRIDKRIAFFQFQCNINFSVHSQKKGTKAITGAVPFQKVKLCPF